MQIPVIVTPKIEVPVIDLERTYMGLPQDKKWDSANVIQGSTKLLENVPDTLNRQLQTFTAPSMNTIKTRRGMDINRQNPRTSEQ